MPALLTRTSTCPNSPYAVSTSSSRASQRPTCAATGRARRPVCSRTSAAVFAQLQVAAGDHHVGAGRGQAEHHLAAEAPAAAGDQRDLAAEVDGGPGPAGRCGHAGTGSGPTTAAAPSVFSSSGERPSSPVSAASVCSRSPGRRCRPAPRSCPCSAPDQARAPSQHRAGEVDEGPLPEVRVLDDVLRVVDRRRDDLVRRRGRRAPRPAAARRPTPTRSPAALVVRPSARRSWRTSGRRRGPGGPSPRTAAARWSGWTPRSTASSPSAAW